MDIRLNFVERGAGEPLVLLHGNGESHAYFAAQIDRFARTRRVLAPDTRGHGASPRGTAPFTIAQFALDLAAFLDERRLDQTDLLGFSDGANIALTFALAHPERVRRLVLNGANLCPEGVKRRVQLPIELGYRAAKRAARRDMRAVRKAELLGLMVNEPHIDPARLQALSIPTLVIAGTRDMIRAEHTRLIARSIPGAELVFLRGTHFIAAEKPDAFCAAVERFLNLERN